MNLREPRFVSFFELLTNNLFKIPEYQRTYSWRRKQRNDLFKDILKLKDSDKEHFMATIVCLGRDSKRLGGNKFEVLDVVDGQQRITSLIILLKSLYKSMIDSNDEDEKIAEDLQKILVKERDNTIILLQTNHDTSNIFSQYLRDGRIPDKENLSIESEKNLRDAFVESEQFINDWNKDYEIAELYEIIMDKLKFIFHIIEDEGIVYTVFEVLNSRGLPVDWLDKTKSLLMGIVFETTEQKETINTTMSELHTIWSNIYREIGLNEVQGDEIVRFAATLKNTTNLSKTMGASDSLSFFKNYCTDTRKVIEVSEWILKVAKELLDIRQSPFLSTVTKIAHVRLLKLAFELRTDFTKAEKSDLRELWEKVSFRIFGFAGKDSRSKVGDYVRLAQNIYLNKQSINKNLIAFPYNDVKNAIRNLGVDFPIEKVIEEIRNKDLYESNDWKSELRYFFFKYEVFLNKKKGYNFPDIVWQQIWGSKLDESIEHIYPQNADSRWNEIDESYIHRLGNLTIVTPTINSEAGRKPFDEKKEVYNKENRLLSLHEILSYEEWNETNIEKRENELLSWAKSEWNTNN